VTEPEDAAADVRHSESETGEPDRTDQVAAGTAGDVDLGYQLFDCADGDSETIAAAVDAAGSAIERGECIVMPTDTVYGIAADAFSPAAVQRLLDAKVRGRDMPPPVLIGEPSLIRALAVEIPQQAKDLVKEHWPGPLTVICRMQPSLRMDLGDTEGTIALRVPDHALARRILRRTGPIAVSSANISGLPPAVSCEQALEQLGANVAVYIDAGPMGGADAMPSTIVDFTQYAGGEILRPGALSIEVIRQTLPDVIDLADPPPGDQDADGGSGAGTLPQDPDSSAEAADLDETGTGG
jgi:tRNA threonylcarbamoyl adenosine modification protein (Sua5/YciO/YrdC/YwlC family)